MYSDEERKLMGAAPNRTHSRCKTKFGYMNLSLAQEAADNMESKGKTGNKPYLCPNGGHYHIGHREEK